MKFIKLGLLGLIAMFLITSCEVDPIDPGTGGGGGGGGTTEEGPELIFVDEAGVLTEDSSVAPEEIFSVRLQAAKGTADLNSLTIEENGVRIEDFVNRITIENTPAPSSAILLINTNPESFTWTISIKAQEVAAKHIYKFTVEDTNGNTAFRDIEIDTEATGSGTENPGITLMGNASIITDANSVASFPITALRGSADLSHVAVVNSSGDPIDAARCYLGEFPDGQFTENPQPLSTEDAGGFEKKVWVRAQDVESIETYFIVIYDTADTFELQEVTINTYPNGVAGNDLTTITGALFNRAGPSGTGGLDLDSGASTGSNDAAAELIDNGIDNGPLDKNWIQRISPGTGTTLKQLIPNQNGLSENFEFSSVTKDTQLLDIWGNGTDLTETNAAMVPWTDVVEVGDLFIAERGGKYYMMEVTEVFIDPDKNGDFYKMNIKL